MSDLLFGIGVFLVGFGIGALFTDLIRAHQSRKP